MRSLIPGPHRIAGAFVGAKLLLHLVSQVLTPYEFHRDELLYLAMGDHLQLYRMDFPPFIALAANLQRALLGDHLWAIRVLPALAGAAVLWLAIDATRRLGGRALAQITVGTAVLLSPLFLRVSVLFQPVVFDQLWWTLALWALLRRGLDDDPRWWLGMGVALGMGLLTKFSVGFIALPLAAATLLTGLRRDLRTPWPWVGAGVSILIGHPSLLGQVALSWPFFEQMADLRSSQLSRVTYGAFLGEQLLMVGPTVLLGLVGLAGLLRAKGLRTLRVLDGPAEETSGGPGEERFRAPALRAAALTGAGALLLLIVLRGKPYYAGPIHPILMAGGAATLAFLGRSAASGVASRAARGTLVLFVALQAAFGLVTLPMGLPVLDREPMARYSAWLGVTAATRTNVGVQLELPQDYADMLGWEAFADTVAEVWGTLPASEQDQAVLLATNYGRAGALDHYGPERGLPSAVAPIGSYWFWGPGDREWEVAVVAGSDSVSLAGFFEEVREAARIRDPWRVPEERDLGVFVVRSPYEPIAEVWPRFEGRN
jgi:4-amino-4-deoxy-L-arabinose transferase-like glycosyltransferase